MLYDRELESVSDTDIKQQMLYDRELESVSDTDIKQ